jgi:hypothetical protein
MCAAYGSNGRQRIAVLGYAPSGPAGHAAAFLSEFFELFVDDGEVFV